jgi:hypothetical protein
MADRYHQGGKRPYPSPRPPSRPRGSWPRWLRIAVWLVVTIAVLAIVGGLVAYRAARHVPEFYRQAMAVSLQDHAAAADKMVRQATGLASDVQKEGRWTAAFTAEEINGWLAVELVKGHRELLPPNFSDPRVAITPDGATLACRYRSGAIDVVASLAVDVYLAEPGVVALRVRGARAGSLPLPLGQIVEEISRATNRLEWQVRWSQTDGDPVALISIPPPRNRGDKAVRIDAVELGDGEIRVAGTSGRR